MSGREVSGRAGGVVPHVRTEPVQERSAARIDRLLDAAAAIVDEVGLDRITTAMVAERAGASIGTVYRYFPDRIALLQALRERTVARYRANVITALERDKPTAWWQAVDQALDTFAEMFRSEPGALVIRFDETERGLPLETEGFGGANFADWFGELLVDRFGLPPGEALRFDLEVAVEIGDSLIRRAFLFDAHGDERFLTATRNVVHEFLAARYGGDDHAEPAAAKALP